MFVNHKFMLFAIALNAKLLFGLEMTNDDVDGDDDDLESNIPSFRIVAPEFLCGESQAEDSVPTSNEITISTQTRGGQKLEYRVQIYFVVLGKLKGQQHTLSIWKSIRQLQRKIASEKDDISLKNQISIHNSQLTPGVQYTFEIVGVDEAGRESKSQNFTIVYREGKFGTEIQQDGTSTTEEVSLLLIGSETSYGDMPIIIEARSIWCTPNNDFYMKWDIKPADNRNGLLDYFNIKGKLLRIPSGILKADETYQISVQLLKNEDDKFITKAEMRLTIITREYSARILPEILMIGINNEVEINLVLKDSDNTGNKFDITWSCHLADGTTCEDFTPSETSTQTVQFYSKGEYKVGAVVVLNGVPKTLSSNITVNPDIIAYPQILNLPTKAISVSDNFELNAIIMDLVPNCYAEWTVLKAAGFSYFNETQIPGGLGNMTIHDVEETFLSELVDYGNDTITRSIPLKIPKQNSDWDPKWPGLVSNSKYKFRLNIVCPEPIDDSKTEARKNIESFTDVVIETNAPPVPQPMEVEPLVGDSLRTLFKFSTGVAKDRPADYPLKYVFYYVIDGFVINLGEFYETMMTTTDLPYSKSGIQTYYQVCDSRDACSNDVPGPNITMTLIENVTDIELQFKSSFIQKNMETMNLESSFNTAIACLLTYQHFTDKKYFNQIQMTIIEAIKSTISKIKNQEVFIYSNDEILYFIKLSKKILDVIDYKEKDIYKGLLELIDNIDEDSANDGSDQSKGRMVDLFADIRRRVKRSQKNFANQRVNQRDKNRDKIITALDLYEKVVDDEELVDFVKRIEQEIRIFCKVIKDQKPLVYAKDYIAFEAIKTYDPQQFQEPVLVIPFDKYPGNKSKFNFSKKIQFPLDGNYCYAKIFYPKRNNANLVENEDVYQFMLFQNGEEKKIRLPLHQKLDKHFLYEIPFSKIGDGKELKCAVRTDLTVDWDYINCETTGITESVIKCRCFNFGLFRADEMEPEKTTTQKVEPVVPIDNTNEIIDSKTTTTTITSTTTILTTTVTNEQSTTTLLTTTVTESTTTKGTTTIGSEIVELDTNTMSITSTEPTTTPTTTTAIDGNTNETTTNTITSTIETTTLVPTTTSLPETTSLLPATTSTMSVLPEITTLITTSTNSLSSVISEPITGESETTELTSTTTTQQTTTNLEVSKNISEPITPNSPAITIDNVEIINQTTTPLQIKDDLTTIVTKLNISEPITPNSAAITTDNVEIINQTTTPLQIKNDLTTIVTKLNISKPITPNSPAITTDNVEIINQTTKPLQIKDDLTTIVTKLNNNVAIIDGETNDPNINNQTNKITNETNAGSTTNGTTIGAKTITNSTEDDPDGASERNTITSIGISSALSFVIFCGFFGLIFGVLYNKRKRMSTTVQETEILATSVRQPSQGLRYARFYDAMNMGGSSHFVESPIR